MSTIYKRIFNDIKTAIDSGMYKEGDSLLSENDICMKYNTTRATVRLALIQLSNSGYIDKHKGKRSVVSKPNKGLGILSINGVTAAIGKNELKTIIIKKPEIKTWDSDFFFELTSLELEHNCVTFSRLRTLKGVIVLYEETFIANYLLPKFTTLNLENKSLFNVLQSKYNITIKRGEQNMWSLIPDKRIKAILKLKNAKPVIHLKRKLITNIRDVSLYSFIYCNTEEYYLQDFF